MAASVWLGMWQTRAQAVEGRAVSSYTLLVRGDPRRGQFGVSSTVELLDGESGASVARVRMTSSEAYEDGARLRVVGRMKALDDSDWSRSRFMKGEVGSVQVVKVLEMSDEGPPDLIGSLRRAVLAGIEPAASEARALLAGTICGRTTELAEAEANGAFSRCGLSHLVAVSGSHLAFISMLLDAALRSTRVRRQARSGLILLVMMGYVVFTGCAPSAVRSVVMVAASMAAGLFQRRAHPLSGLSLTVCVLVLLDAGVVYDLGFQLSALSVLFLLVFGRYGAHLLERAGLPTVLSEPLALTLTAQWATLPWTIPVFGEVSLIAPLANVVVGPVMSAVLVVGLVTVPLVVAVPGASAVLLLPDALSQVSIFLAELFAGIPYASMAIEAPGWLLVVMYGCALALYLAWRDFKRRTLLLAMGCVVAVASAQVVRWALFAPAAVTVLDVGQADAILVRDGARAMLVDAGVDDEVVAALARNHVFHLDAVVVTHWDRDHWGGLSDVLEKIPVDCIIVADGAAASAPQELRASAPEIQELAEGDVLRVGGFSCEMVWPDEPVAGEENGESLCLAVGYDDGATSLSVLLTGDTERDELERYAREAGDVDVLKVGHHGSRVSLSPEALGVLRPEVAVASAGAGNSYGHPDPASVACAREAGAQFFCTMDVGDIILRPGATGPRVDTARDASAP